MSDWRVDGIVLDSENEEDLVTSKARNDIFVEARYQHDEADAEAQWRSTIESDKENYRGSTTPYKFVHNPITHRQPSIILDDVSEYAKPRNSFLDHLSQTSSLSSTLSFRSVPSRPPVSQNSEFATPHRPIEGRQAHDSFDSPLSILSKSPTPVKSVVAANGPCAISKATGLANNDDIIAVVPPPPGAQQHNLRQRTSKQLRPFLADREAYLQLCRSRGIRPVHVLETVAHVYDHQSDQSSQESSAFFSSSPPFTQAEADGATHLASSLEVSPRQSETTQVQRSARSRGKRRRLNSDGTTVVSEQTTGARRDVYTFTSSPLVPAGSPVCEKSPQPGLAKFRWPPGMTPIVHLPTPETSSGIRGNNESLRGNTVQTKTPTTKRVEVVLTSSESEDSESDDQQDRYLAAQMRRVKGVLPASWITLNNQIQLETAPKPRREPFRSLPTPNTTIKGVARRLARAHVSTSAIVLDLSDASSSSEEAEQPVQYRQQRLNFQPFEQPDICIDVDNMEYDFVDPLLPGASTRRKDGPKPSKKRGKNHTKRASNRATDGADGLPIERRVTAGSKRRQHQIIPRLSIIDLTRSGSPQPQFVRIAARQARKAPSNARHLPTSKHIRLATRQDTNDAQHTLVQWEQGALRPEKSPPSTVMRSGMSLNQDRTPLGTDRQKNGRSQPRSRPAQLESLESELRAQHRAAAFQQRINALSERFSIRPAREGVINVTVRDPNDTARRRRQFFATPQVPVPSINAVEGQSFTARPQRLRRRKPPPVRIDVQQEQYDQPLSNEPVIVPPSECDDEVFVRSESLDLSQIPDPLTLDYGVKPWSRGLQLTPTSFVGSGDFAACLTLARWSMDEPRGSIRIELGYYSCNWSSWTEIVKTDLPRVLDALTRTIKEAMLPGLDQVLTDDINGTVEYLLRSITRYLTSCIYFHDPIDVQDCISALMRFCGDLYSATRLPRLPADTKTTVLQYALVLCTQLISLAAGQAGLRRAMDGLVRSIARDIVIIALPTLVQAPVDPDGDHNASTVAVVILHHCLGANVLGPTTWSVINDVLEETLLHNDVNNIVDGARFDQVWKATFRICPLLQLGTRGELSRISLSHCTPEDWSLLRKTMDRAFQLYDTTAGSMMNSHIRLLLSRSMELLTTWHWYKCEHWLASLYDAFVRRKLQPLRDEPIASASFLDSLAAAPVLTLHNHDPAYHIFLKLVATAILSMRRYGVYTEKKVRSVVWRLIPGNPRVYENAMDMHEADATSLRNHYDLLCTLYYAAPTNARIEASVLMSLVDYTTSHRAACLISVRAWTRLIGLQATLSEPLVRLDGFVSWFQAIMDATMKQYRLARIEAEDDFHKLRARADFTLSNAHLDSVIANNQREVAATIIDALSGLRQAVSKARNIETTAYLLDTCRPLDAIAEFNITDRALKSLFLECLQLVQVSVTKVGQTTRSSGYARDDSQDYGDVIEVDRSIVTEDRSHQKRALLSLQSPMRQIMSNGIGVDTDADDAITIKIVETWLVLLHQLVRVGELSWHDVISSYGTASWHNLRDTSQHRTFTARAYATIVDLDAGHSLKLTSILSSWLKALVARRSALRFQHDMTTAILNVWPADPLLYNLPFAKTAGKYSITLQEISDRRLNLVAMLFANMRESLSDGSRAGNQDKKRLYSDALRIMMGAMKDNYTELQAKTTSTVTSTDLQGDYVEFVQAVVALMQQYTTSVSAIDRFFTDSTAFPLPVDDPTYMVGRLRSYDNRLAALSTQKELAVFIHTACLRAMVDDESTYIINQLSLAVGQEVEIGNAASPSLRMIFLTGLIPAYINTLPKHEQAWRLSLPLLTAAKIMSRELLYRMDTNDEQSIASVEAMTCNLVRAATGLLINVHQGTNPARIVPIVPMLFELCTNLLTLVEVLQRRFGRATKAVVLLCQLQQHCAGVNEDNISMLNEEGAINSHWRDISRFTAGLISETLHKEVRTEQNDMWIRRAGTWKRIDSRLVSPDHDRAMRDARDVFVQDHKTIFGRLQGMPQRTGDGEPIV